MTLLPGACSVVRPVKVTPPPAPRAFISDLEAAPSRASGALDERSEAIGGGDPAGSAGGAGGKAPRGIDERSEEVGGRDPVGRAGGKAIRKINDVTARARVRELLAGNICRCTGYQLIVDAVIAAAREVEREPARERAHESGRDTGREPGFKPGGEIDRV
jgi:hypothetical protein